MKKYIKPEFEVVEMDTESIIAASQLSVSDDEHVGNEISRRRGDRWGEYGD